MENINEMRETMNQLVKLAMDSMDDYANVETMTAISMGMKLLKLELSVEEEILQKLTSIEKKLNERQTQKLD